MSVQPLYHLLPEEASRCAPKRADSHTVDECDRMLALTLTHAVANAWLDERLLAMRTQAR